MSDHPVAPSSGIVVLIAEFFAEAAIQLYGQVVPTTVSPFSSAWMFLV